MADINFAKYGTPVTKTSNGVDFSKYGVTSDTKIQQPEQKNSFLGNLVKAPLTTLARPIQAIAEYAGASSEAVDKATSKIPLIGKLIAPVPQNGADVKKDVGRGIQTAALGLGPVSGGATFGLGNSLEQGNDVFSKETAAQTGIGALGGKLLDLAGKPLLDVTGKGIGKIIPQTIKDVTSKGAQAVSDFAAQHQILPQGASDAINTGAKGLENIANKPFDMAGTALKSTGNAVKNLIQKEYPSLSLNEDRFTKAKNNIAQTYEKTLPLTPTEKARESTLLQKTGDNVYTTAAKHGINIGSEEAPVQIQGISDQFANATKHAQSNEHGYFNVDEIKQNAFDHVDDSVSSETSRETAKKKIAKEIDALVKNNKSSVSKNANGQTIVKSDLVERLRKTGNSWTNFNSADPEKLGQSTGYALSNAVRDQVSKEGTFPAYREANKEWGKILHLQEVLGKIEAAGKPFKIPGGLSGSISRRVLSGMLGYHTAGIGGAILGELGSEMGAKILANPELRTYFDRQIVEKFASKNPTPEAITKLENQIREYINKQSDLLQLPAPKSIQLGGPSQSGIIPPRVASAEELLAAQKVTGTT